MHPIRQCRNVKMLNIYPTNIQIPVQGKERIRLGKGIRKMAAVRATRAPSLLMAIIITVIRSRTAITSIMTFELRSSCLPNKAEVAVILSLMARRHATALRIVNISRYLL